jgi:hypothetical protein
MSAWEYIYLAVGSGILGIIMTFVVVLVCRYLGIDMLKHLWVVAIPVILSLFLNVSFIELYRKNKKK